MKAELHLATFSCDVTPPVGHPLCGGWIEPVRAVQDGKVKYTRTSATRDPKARAEPEGLVDPFLKVLSFFDGDRPLAALNYYATHPMSFYGDGRVTSDFCGLARDRRANEDDKVLQ